MLFLAISDMQDRHANGLLNLMQLLLFIFSSFWKQNAKAIADVNSNILTCFSRAWQKHNDQEVSYSYCPEVDFRRYLGMHGSMSHIYYYKYMQSQPPVFRGEPLPNFEDVFSQPIELSIQSTKHLEKVGLLSKGSIDKETRINKLYLKVRF